MPIYEFQCRACEHHFEELVLPWLAKDLTTLACPSCHRQDVERMVSLFAVDSETTRQSHLAHGRKHAVKVTQEKKHEELKMMRDHHH